MHHLPRRLRHLTLLLSSFVLTASLVAAATPTATTERTFTTSSGLSLEIRTLIRLLEEVHYNREAVKPANYAQIVPDFMTSLDGQHLFFLDSDKQDFATRHTADSLYWNITSLGKIDPAYEIFNTYQKRVEARVTWILAELQKDIPLTATDTYTFDRSKADWPADATAADDLWHRRLKFELLQEILNQKPTANSAAKVTNPEPTANTTLPVPPTTPTTAPAPNPTSTAPAVAKTSTDPKTVVSKRYERMLKNLTEIDSSELSELFLNTIARLYDPHSDYFSASTYEDFGIQMRLQLVGIGAVLGLEDDQCVVKELVPGGPADLEKHLKPNDRIIAVTQDGAEPVEIIGMKLRKIVNLIRGQKDTNIRLTVEPAANPNERKEITITRDVVNLDSARANAAVFQVPTADGKSTIPLGVITLPAFYGPDASTVGQDPATATKDVAELIKRLQAAHVQGIVLDLRRNGGGLLSEAISLAGLFIKTGPIVQVRSHDGDVKVDKDDDPAIAYTGPLAVLTSRFSASASEIVAGALQNYGRALIIGDSSTHGKGTVQTLVEMRSVVPQLARLADKSGATKLTIQKFYLPNGSSTQLKGVVPDIILPSIDDYLPIGESSLPHALGWDEIPASKFDGHALDLTTLAPLRLASEARQKKLAEFSFLQRSIAWFKTRQEEKTVSLNLADRQKQKDADAARKKQMDAELKTLENNDGYAFTEILLAPPPPPHIKAETPADTDPIDDALAENPDERYGKMDIALREALRVIQDATLLKPEPPLWLLDAPHTAQAEPRATPPAAATP